jgi:uroporphyrinogen decarboxylase
MQARDRVLSALEHGEPERIPVDLSGHRSSGISALLYPRLRRFLGLPEVPVRVYDLIQQLAVVDDDVLDLFGVDTIELGRGFAQSEEDWIDWVLPDGSPCLVPNWCRPEREENRWVLLSRSGRVVGQMPDGTLYFNQCYFPFADEEEDLTDLERVLDESVWHLAAPPPGPVLDAQLREGASRLRESTDRAILGLFGGSLYETGQMLYRNDGFLLLLAGEPLRAHRFLDHLTEYHLERLDRYLSIVGPFIDVIVFTDDLGMQTGLQISPEMYREFFKSRHGALCERVRKSTDLKVMLHSCGGIRELLPDLIDLGLDAINPVQISCPGMDARELKSEFGRAIAFWGGGCELGHTLHSKSPEELARHVRERVEILSPEGGFVFQAEHNILSDVPPENVVAIFEAVAGLSR